MSKSVASWNTAAARSKESGQGDRTHARDEAERSERGIGYASTHEARGGVRLANDR
jgi:hypothetical protein